MYKRKISEIDDEKSSKKQRNEIDDIDIIEIEKYIDNTMDTEKVTDKITSDKINVSEKIDNFIDGYPFSVITESPIIGNNLNFYTQFANYDNNKYFFNTMLELEKYYYILNKNKQNEINSNEKHILNKNELLKIYMNMLFKIDTIHDFTDNRSVINNIRTFDKQYIKSLLNWDNDSIKKFIKEKNVTLEEKMTDEEDIINNIDNISQDVDVLYEENGVPIEQEEIEEDSDTNETEGEKNIIKGNNSIGMENALLYWLIKNFKYNDNNLYTSSSIENFSNDLSEQNVKLNIVIDAGEKRITNFKDLLLFQKYINIKKKEDEKNTNYYDKNEIIQKMNKFDNLNCTVIFPQLFDANSTTGKSIKWRNVDLISMNFDIKDSYFIEFDIINDKCKMIYNDDKSFDFFINNDNYLLNQIKMIKTDDKFSDNGIIIDNIYMYNKQLIEREKQLEIRIEELKNEWIKNDKKNIDTNIKKTKEYKKREKIKLYKKNLDNFLKKNNNINYSICLNSGPGVYLLSEYYQNKTKNLSDNISYIINVYENIINSSTDEDYDYLIKKVNIIKDGKKIKKILSFDKKIKNTISEKYGISNEYINNNINIFENIIINGNKNGYYDFINNIIRNNIKENLVKEIKIINDRISEFQDYNIYNKRELYYILKLLFTNIRRTLSNKTTINGTLSNYNDNLAHNIFTIKRAGDYSQIYYCKYYGEENSDYIYCSNDRMSASFCYLNKVNFIGPFSDAGIFINFNNNIKIRYSETSFNIDDKNYYPYMNVTKAPDISKYIKYIQLNEISVFDNKIFNNLDKLLELEIKKNKKENIIKSYKDLSFKIDTIHDFEGSRVKSKINNIIDILWDDINFDKNLIKQLILEVIKNDNFEKIYFYWLLKRQSNINISKNNKLLHNPVITFTSSIENFANCIILNENKKIFFNIDASNESIKNFKNIVISNLINIDKLKEYTTEFKEDNKNLKNIYIQYNKIYNEIFINKILDDNNTKDIEKSNRNYIIKCIYNIIMNHYEEPELSQGKNKEDIKGYFDNFLNIFIIDKDENANMYINRIINNYINKYNFKEKGIIDILTREKNIDLSKKKKKKYENKEDIKVNINLINEILNKLIQLPVYSNFIINIVSLIKLINNDIINFNIYDIENITKLIEPLRDNIIQLINKPISKSKNIKNIISNNIYSYIENEFNSYYNEVVSVDFINLSYNNLYNKLFLQYVHNTLSSENNNIQFKITPPQLIDANATTGISIKLKNINILSKTDNDSKPCNYLLFNFLNFIKNNKIEYNKTFLIKEFIRIFNIYYKSFNKIYNDINITVNDIINKLNKYETNDILVSINKIKNTLIDNINESKTIFYNTEEMKIKEKKRKEKEKEKNIKNSNEIYNIFYESVNTLNDFVLIYKEYIYEIIYYIKNNYNINLDINYIKNKLIDLKLYSSNEKIYNVNKLLELYKKLLHIIKYNLDFMNNLLLIIVYHNRNKCFEDINILSDNINTLYNIEQYFMYHIIDNKIQTEPIGIETMTLSFDNKNYMIRNVKVLKIDNNETDDIEYINKNMNVILRKNNMLNIMASIILKDCNTLINNFIKNKLKIYDENNINNIINMTNKEDNNIVNFMNIYINNKNILIKPIEDKEFYYSILNYTLYSLENGSPGVKDLLKIHESIVKFYDNNSSIFLNNLYKNIFAIKRSGDYLQIDYCKKNNYIFISNDAISASFCFIENCDFIGPFGPYGLFIKKKLNDKEYCYTDKYDKLLYN